MKHPLTRSGTYETRTSGTYKRERVVHTRARFDTYLQQRVALQQELETLMPVDADELERAAALVENFATRLKACGSDIEEQAKLVQEIVERVYVQGDRVVGMTLKPIFHLVLNHRLRGTMRPAVRKNDVPGDAHKP